MGIAWRAGALGAAVALSLAVLGGPAAAGTPASDTQANTTAAAPTPETLAATASGLQSAQAQLDKAEHEVRAATQQAQQLSYAVVALRDQQAEAQVAADQARAGARRSILLAYDGAAVDPTATLFADLNGTDPGLGDQVRNRRMADADQRVRRMQDAVAHLADLSRTMSKRLAEADRAAAHAVGEADLAQIDLAHAAEVDLAARHTAELAAQAQELAKLNTQLEAALAAINAASPQSAGSEPLTADTPAELRSLYQDAAKTCPGLPWGVLAAIGQVETDNGKNKAVSSAGAMGPMQFMPATWAIYGVDGDHDGKADILDQVDAVYSAAHYLCVDGGGNPATLYNAIFHYNHSDYYVNTVLGLAAQNP